MSVDILSKLLYIVAAVLFIIGLKMLGRAQTARRGNLISAVGMLLAIVGVLLSKGLAYPWIIVGVLIGGIIGVIAARVVRMTSMPEMVALFNGFGGIASLLVGWAEYTRGEELPGFTLVALILAVLIGGITFTGSLIAFGKLSEYLDGKPVLFQFQKLLNAALLVLSLVLVVAFAAIPEYGPTILAIVIILAFVLGVLATIPIGGADMPVVISLLNSYSGLAACAAGFAIANTALIVTGALVGASGIILTQIMCAGMNRSLGNVLFAGMGATAGKAAAKVEGEAKPVTTENAFPMLEAARSVVFVPGYGMAVAQAQHAVRELGDLLTENGTEVRYAIHPVAGRMPGHMNVLLAEADVDYDQLVEPQDVNPTMETVDVAMVIGANDVVNPAAKTMPDSPLYGMPIIEVDRAKTVIILKRSMRSGFAGVDNPLFVGENSRMLFGDAKASLTALVSEFKELRS